MPKKPRGQVGPAVSPALRLLFRLQHASLAILLHAAHFLIQFGDALRCEPQLVRNLCTAVTAVRETPVIKHSLAAWALVHEAQTRGIDDVLPEVRWTLLSVGLRAIECHASTDRMSVVLFKASVSMVQELPEQDLLAPPKVQPEPEL